MRLMRACQGGFIAVLMVVPVACGGGSEAPVADTIAEVEVTEPAETPRQPVKTPRGVQVNEGPQDVTDDLRPGLVRREPCGGSSTCQNLGEVSVGHGAPGVQVYFDPERDDEIVQWSRVLGNVIECVEGGDDLGSCVAASDADEACKAEFIRLSDASNDRLAFEAVFLTPGSPCRPEEAEVQP